MNIDCMIIDDEPLSRSILKKFIEEYPNLNLVTECKDALEAMGVLDTQEIDLIFLDINMPKLSGINFYKSLTKKPKVIFTTAYPEFAIEGFELEAVDYLLKPISFERFAKAINKLSSYNYEIKASEADNFIMIKSDKKIYKIEFRDIRYIESIGDYCKIHTPGKTIISSETLKSFMEMLPQEFIRIHKSFIISTAAMSFIEGNQVKIDEQFLPIGQSYKGEFLKKLS